MKTVRLPKDKLDYFASVLQKFGEVHAPVEQNGQYAFKCLKRWSDACLDYPRTILPPKKYLLPPSERMFLYRDGQGYLPSYNECETRTILLGVHSCDIFAISILDRVFGEPHPDPYYGLRRANTAIIGINCKPDEHCFCYSMRADFVEDGFDLFLFDIGDHYLIFVGTALGDDMILAAGKLCEAATHADFEQYKLQSSRKRRSFVIDVEIRDLPEIFEMEYHSAIWNELGERCLSCGSCSMVCPTCYCFDVTDSIELGVRESIRARAWDSCLFSAHAKVADGENFREERASRVKFRFYHKQRGFVAEYGRPSCVGCGRCIVACPVAIDIVEVLKRLRGVEHVIS